MASQSILHVTEERRGIDDPRSPEISVLEPLFVCVRLVTNPYYDVDLVGRKNIKETKQPPSLKWNQKVIHLSTILPMSEINKNFLQNNPSIYFF